MKKITAMFLLSILFLAALYFLGIEISYGQDEMANWGLIKIDTAVFIILLVSYIICTLLISNTRGWG
jgi:hypothetical protein